MEACAACVCLTLFCKAEGQLFVQHFQGVSGALSNHTPYFFDINGGHTADFSNTFTSAGRSSKAVMINLKKNKLRTKF